MIRKNILVTFDYELFLGRRSGSVQDCMTVPTEKLSEIMDNHGVKGIFFVDTTCLLRMREMADQYDRCRADLQEVLQQLNSLSERGHHIFPHLHPHWKDAVYDHATNNWSLTDTRHYRLHSIGVDERKKILSDSIKLLHEVTQGRTGQQIDSFRAGGWCIQPFSDLKPIFSELGVTNDFSVQKGFYQFTDAQYFDYSICPENHIYRFTDDVCKEDEKGEFVEYSINSITIPSFNQLLGDIYLKFYYRITGDHTFSNGEGHVPVDDPQKRPASDIGVNIGSSRKIQRISIELMHPLNHGIYKSFIRKHDYMHFISHPKMINNLNIKCFDRFLSYCKREFEIESDFRKMTA